MKMSEDRTWALNASPPLNNILHEVFEMELLFADTVTKSFALKVVFLEHI